MGTPGGKALGMICMLVEVSQLPLDRNSPLLGCGQFCELTTGTHDSKSYSYPPSVFLRYT